MRVLVTGATGAIGPAVVAVLAEHGHTISVLTRGTVPDEVRARASYISAGDIKSPADVSLAAAGAEAIVHLAALLHVPADAPVGDEVYERVNVQGTRHVIAAARAAGASRLVFASTVGVYGDATPGTVDEMTPIAPATAYARSKAAAEALLMEARSIGLSPVILRLSAVYGEHMKGHYRQLVAFMRKGPLAIPGDGRNRRSLIFDEDAARAIAIALTHPAAPGRVFNVANETPYEVRRTLLAISAALGRRPPPVFLPRPLALGAARALELASRATGGGPPAIADQLRKFNQDFTVDVRAIATTMGFRASTTLEDGWRRTIAALDRRASTV